MLQLLHDKIIYVPHPFVAVFAFAMHLCGNNFLLNDFNKYLKFDTFMAIDFLQYFIVTLSLLCIYIIILVIYYMIVTAIMYLFFGKILYVFAFLSLFTTFLGIIFLIQTNNTIGINTNSKTLISIGIILLGYELNIIQKQNEKNTSNIN